MTDPIRFHLDEHMSLAIADALRQRGIDVTTPADVGLRTADDVDHLAFARRDGRVIVTKDADFLRLTADAADHPGIVSCRRRGLSTSGIIHGLLLIHGVLTPADMIGHVEYL